MGRRTIINQKANIELKKIFEEKNIKRCEMCGATYGLTFAHRHKRLWYYNKPDKLLWDFNQVILCCIQDHMKLEKSEQLTKDRFLWLRGKEQFKEE